MPEEFSTAHQQKALLEHERMSSLIHSMADGVIALDMNLKIVLYNGAALNILNSNGNVEGRHITDVLKPVDASHQPVDLEELITHANTATTTRDYYVQYDDDSKIALFLSITPVSTGYTQASASGYVLLVRDITREKSLEEERDEFISVISHELRTPITISEGSISNALYVAKQGGDKDAIVKALNAAHEQILYLADMLNDLSTLARAEREMLTLDLEEINMTHLLKDIHTSYQEQATEKHLELKLDIDPHLEVLNSSKLYVQEVLQNFITNAIKYTESGSVTIEAKQSEYGVYVAIHDTGIGISRSDQQRIFDKFFRSEDYRTRRNNGTGLGLYITMKLIQLLHAHLDVMSELEKGSTFAVTFPNLPVISAGSVPRA